MSVLLLRLAGPMQAWGTQSRFSVRDTGLEPSKSGVIGVLCAALGKPRRENGNSDSPSLAELAGLRMAVRVDRPGTMLLDFHTAGDVMRASGERPPREGDPGFAVTSTRYYLSDADFLVALQGVDALLARLDGALQNPVWPLCLGRKAFPPAMPVRAVPDGPVGDTDAVEALKAHPWWYRSKRERPVEPPQLRIAIECDDPGGGDVRNDVPLSFDGRDRLFTVRRIRDVETWTVPAPLIQRWPPCTCPD